jgi:hypothetical protein
VRFSVTIMMLIMIRGLFFTGEISFEAVWARLVLDT